MTPEGRWVRIVPHLASFTQLSSTDLVGSALSDRKWNKTGFWEKSLISFANGTDNALLLHTQQCQKYPQLQLAELPRVSLLFFFNPAFLCLPANLSPLISPGSMEQCLHTAL